MALLTISAAARVCGVDSRTLQRAIQAGRLTLDAQHCLSREALVAAGYLDATTPQGTPQETPQRAPQDTPQDLARLTTVVEALVEAVTTLVDRLTPQHATVAPQADTAPATRRVAPVPQDTPQETPHVVRPATAAPQPGGATAESPGTLPAHIQRIAELAAEYDKLSLAELAQLLFDRAIYRAADRATGGEKPVNRGTLTRWLQQARDAGVL